MRSMYVPKTIGMAMLAAGIAASLTSLTLRLFKNDVTPDENLTTDDAFFEEANFSGYAAAEDEEFEQHYLAVDGQQAKAHIWHQFNYVEPGSSPVTNNVFGYYITDGDDLVVGAARFDEAFTVNSNNASVPVQVTLDLLLPGLGV